MKQLYSAPDVQALSYRSNGKTQFIQRFLILSFRPDVYYHMVIQPASHYDPPGRDAAVYADEVYYNHKTGKWVRELYETFSNGVSRTIYINNNYTGFIS